MDNKTILIKILGFVPYAKRFVARDKSTLAVFKAVDSYKNKFEYTDKDDFDILLFTQTILWAEKDVVNELKEILRKRNIIALFYTGENMLRGFNYPYLGSFVKAARDFIVKKYFPISRYHKIAFLKNHPGKFFGILTNSGFDEQYFFSLPYFLRLLISNSSLIPKLESKNTDNIRNKKFCAFSVSNPSDLHRISFCKKLSKYKKVDSYGKVLKNCEYPKELLEAHKKAKGAGLNRFLLKEYKFNICFENSVADDYITEKLLNTMVGGAIPIYRGARNVGDYFNTGSFINYHDYGSYDKMIEKVIELDNDDEKYREFLQQPWCTEKNLENIEKKKKDTGLFVKKLVEQVERNRQRK